MGQVYLASKTMQAIEGMLVADQGAAFRVLEKEVLPTLDDAYRGVDDAFRSHMGASIMGDECGRAIWYSFHWYTLPHFDGRMLRLFNRGHLEEGRIIALLRMIGVKVYSVDANGKQFRISGSSGHYGGSGDGVGVGIPDLDPALPCILEFKTHSDKYFTEVKLKGVREAKWDHFVQMQQYMRKMNITVALYVAVNKNTDEIYMELVPLDAAIADQFIERADKIIWMQEVPQRMPNASAGWFACKWCDHRPVCHLGAAPARNCRTCKFSEPVAGGDAVWMCKHPKHLTPQPIDKQLQLTGCEVYAVKKL